MRAAAVLIVSCLWAQLTLGAPHTIDELLKEPRIGAQISRPTARTSPSLFAATINPAT